MAQKQPTIQDWMVEHIGTSLKVESPMEALFASSMKIVRKMCGYETVFLWDEFVAQHCVEDFRLDFAICGDGKNGRFRIGVEIDGHDFHERTKEQASRDRRKDRILTTAGWQVVRFTGSDVYRNSLGCAHEVCELIHKAKTGLTGPQATAQFYLDRIARALGVA